MSKTTVLWNPGAGVAELAARAAQSAMIAVSGSMFAAGGGESVRRIVSAQPSALVTATVNGTSYTADELEEAALAEAVDRFPLSNAALLAAVDRLSPPQRWYDEHAEGL